MGKPIRKTTENAPQETVPCRGISSSTGAPCKNKIKLTPGIAPQPHFCHLHRHQQLQRFATRRSAKEEALGQENSVQVLTDDFKNWKIEPLPKARNSFINQPPTKSSSEKPTSKKPNFFSKAKNFLAKLNNTKSPSPFPPPSKSRNNFLTQQNSRKQPQETVHSKLRSQIQLPSNHPLHNLPSVHRQTEHVFGKPSFPLDPTPVSTVQPQQVVICRGIKRSGQSCTMKVRLPEANNITESSYYCRHHRDQTQPLDLSARWLQDWIPRDVSTETKYKLQVEMAKPISEGDQPGFIYVYQTEELGSDGRSVHNFYKVGRTNNLPRRLYQWNKGCGKLVKLIESFPSAVSPNSRCPYSHRLERLIHIHLSDKYKVEPFYCGGCSRYHTEWFMAPSSDYYLGKYPGWPKIRQIIQHWLRFVNALERNQGSSPT